MKTLRVALLFVCTASVVGVLWLLPGCSGGTNYAAWPAHAQQAKPDWRDGFSDARRAASVPMLGDIPILGPLFRGAAGDPQSPSATSLYTTMMPGSELWVIQRSGPEDFEYGDDTPTSGSLITLIPTGKNDKKTEVPIPLEHTDVTAEIDGYIAAVKVTQTFHNPFDEKIEVLYVFPLPQDSAVDGFVMTIGDRQIRGIIREREEAQRIYYDAKRQGYKASLLTQERPNIFTQRVANIEPGKRIGVNVTYFHTLPYRDGWFEFVFPMVVGPRFNPPYVKGERFQDGVGAVAQGAMGASGQETELQYLLPSERSGHDISLSVSLNAGVAIEELNCPTHLVEITRDSARPSVAQISLCQRDAVPNKDFVLRYRVAGHAIKTAMLTHADARHIEGGAFFSMMIVPPADLATLDRRPLEMVFVVDCSGSMSGEPIAQARDAVTHALDLLGPDDTFQIIRFSNTSSALGAKPLSATRGNVRRGLNYVRNLEARGGTMMIRGIRAALDFPHDPKRQRYVVFLTDGYIGNEAEILGEIRTRLGTTRIFSFGVGSSVNRFLMERMARLGDGVVAYIGLNDDAADVMDLFLLRVSHPALTDLKIEFGSMKAGDVYPKRVPDLFVGRPIFLTGRFKRSGTETVRITGRLGSERVTIDVPIDLDRDRPALASIWARKRIEELADRSTGVSKGAAMRLARQIRDTALSFGLMSAFTSFIAVDASETTEGRFGRTVETPVAVPEGVQYQTTVTGGR